MAIATQCDRCGNYSGKEDLVGCTIHYKRPFQTALPYDLCDKCTEKFLKFISSEENTNGND